jgi:hypothetical protein
MGIRWICWSSMVSVEGLLAHTICIILLSIVSCLLCLRKKYFFGRHILCKQWRWPSDSFLLPTWNCTECSSLPQRKSLAFYNRCSWRETIGTVEKSGLKTRNREVASLGSPIKRLGRAVFRMVSWKGKEHYVLETSAHSHFHNINDTCLWISKPGGTLCH